jgi:hypothetical protein
MPTLRYALANLATPLPIGSATGTSTIEVDGTLLNTGAGITWRDEYVSQDWGDATGVSAPSFENFTIGSIAQRKITLDANDARTNGFEVPHDMLLSTSAALQPEVHIHFRPTTNATGTVIVYLTPEWSKANTTGANPVVAPDGLAEMSLTCTIAAGSAAYPSYVCSFGQLPVNAYNIGDLIGFKIERRTGFGTYTDDIIIDKVAMHVPVDTMENRQMYSKV